MRLRLAFQALRPGRAALPPAQPLKLRSDATAPLLRRLTTEENDR